jgi:hypothetical protein
LIVIGGVLLDVAQLHNLGRLIMLILQTDIFSGKKHNEKSEATA